MERYEVRTLMSAAEIDAGLDGLAERLVPALEGKQVTAVPVLGGAVMFAADLLRRLSPEILLDFMRIQTYGAATSPQKSAQADWLPHEENIRGRTILLLDDILDTGGTAFEARRVLIEELGAAEVLTVVLIDKPVRRAADIQADDRVLLLKEDLFLVGFGLDLAGRFRNLPELRALEPRAEAIKEKAAEEE
ncbi:MAG: hypothetical protein MK213_08740 [Planctomycetes bacterium]|nr:hypothetical protein [Planctomycetota bacterium]